MQNAIQSNLKHPVGVKFNPGFNKIRGPPPPGPRGRFPRPGSIKLSNPEIFVDLQAPFLHPPPRSIPIAIPVGMPLPIQQAGNNHPQPILIQGPPPQQQFPQLQFSPLPQTTSAPPPPPPQLSTIMGKAAYSGFFGKDRPASNRFYNSFPPGPPPLFNRPPQGYRMQQSHTAYSTSNYRPGPPLFGPPAYAQPQVIMGDLAPSASERFQVERIPQVPPVIKIGGHPPEGYTMTHGEQQLVTLKLPDTTMSRKMDSATLLRGAEYTYGADIRRRQDNQGGNILKPGQHPNQHQTHQEDKKLPDVGAIYTVNMVLQTPNISAPTNGSQSPHFQQGMNEMHRIYGSNNKKQSPLDAQVKLLGKLFTELQRLKPPKVNVEPVETIIHYKKDSTDPFGSEPQRYYTPPKVDAPLMAIHIQSYSVPEPGSADPDVLESARMFGLQGHRIDFGNTNEIINLMDTAQKAVSKRIPIDELGYTRGEVNHNLQEWVKGYVTLTRKMKDQAHAKGEGIANQSFRQHQYYRKMFDQSMQPMDPKIFTQGASITNAGAVSTYQG
jgi:hypothetical protein